MKNLKFILLLLIVVAGIVVFSISDPFKIFRRSTTRNTANLVSNIKDIGELVTAEYYGEVIASLNETKIYDIPFDSLKEEFENCYFDLRYQTVQKLLERHRSDKRLKKQKDISDLINPEVLNDVGKNYNKTIYDHLVLFLAQKYSKTNREERFLKNNILQPIAKTTVAEYFADELYDLYKSINKEKEDPQISDFEKYYNDLPGYFQEITSYHYSLNNKQVNKRDDIIMIGRGWVKAGFKFNTFTKRNLAYLKDQKIIRIFGLTPSILDKDINPWFIPELKIKGFELVEYPNRASFIDAKKVKVKCKEKLLEQANNAKILKQAESNGIEALENLFSLLLEEPEIKVELVRLPFENEYEEIAADSLITIDEALRIRSIFDDFKHDTLSLSPEEIYIWKEHFASFIANLEKLNFLDHSHYFNLFSVEAAKILNHKLFVTQRDYDSLRSVRGRLDSNLTTPYVSRNKYFYVNYYPGFAADFNSTLDLIETSLKEVDSNRVTAKVVGLSEYISNNLSDRNYFVFEELKNTSKDIGYSITLKKPKRDSIFLNFYNLRYPVAILDRTGLNSLQRKDTSRVDSVVIRNLNYSNKFSYDSVVNKIIAKELITIRRYYTDSVSKAIDRKGLKGMLKTLF